MTNNRSISSRALATVGASSVQHFEEARKLLDVQLPRAVRIVDTPHAFHIWTVEQALLFRLPRSSTMKGPHLHCRLTDVRFISAISAIASSFDSSPEWSRSYFSKATRTASSTRACDDALRATCSADPAGGSVGSRLLDPPPPTGLGGAAP